MNDERKSPGYLQIIILLFPPVLQIKSSLFMTPFASWMFYNNFFVSASLGPRRVAVMLNTIVVHITNVYS